MAKKKQVSEAAEEEVSTVEVEVAPEAEEEVEVDDGLTVVESDVEVEEAAEEEEKEEVTPTPTPAPSTSSEVLEGFKMLKEVLADRGTPAAVPPASTEESDEDFDKKYDEELFKDSPSKMSRKMIQREAKRLLEKEVGPALGSIMENAFEDTEFRLRNDKKDGPIYDKYEPEIKQLLKTLPSGQQKNPAVLKAVFARVKSLHVDEIVEMRAVELAKERAPASRPVVKKAGGEAPGSIQTSGGVGGGGGTRTVRIPTSELGRLQRQADNLGIDVKELVARWKPPARARS